MNFVKVSLSAATLLFALFLFIIGIYFLSDADIFSQILGKSQATNSDNVLPNLFGITMTLITIVIGVVTIVFGLAAFFGVQAQQKLSILREEYISSLNDFKITRDYLIFERINIEKRIDALVNSYVAAYLDNENILQLKEFEKSDKTNEDFSIQIEDQINSLAVVSASFRIRTVLESLDQLGNCCYNMTTDKVEVSKALHYLLNRQGWFGRRTRITDDERAELKKSRAESKIRLKDDCRMLIDILDKIPKNNINSQSRTLFDAIVEFLDYMRKKERILPECESDVRFLLFEIMALKNGANSANANS